LVRYSFLEAIYPIIVGIERGSENTLSYPSLDVVTCQTLYKFTKEAYQ